MQKRHGKVPPTCPASPGTSTPNPSGSSPWWTTSCGCPGWMRRTCSLPSEDLDLLALAQDVARRLEPAAKEQGLTHGPCRAAGGASGGCGAIVDEMVYNLCDNAVKYNRKGGSVTITVAEGPRDVTLSVADTGIGIPAADRERVFERFLPGGQEPLEGDRRHGAGGCPSSSTGRPLSTNAQVRLESPGGQGHHGDPHLPPADTAYKRPVVFLHCFPQKGRPGYWPGPFSFFRYHW